MTMMKSWFSTQITLGTVLTILVPLFLSVTFWGINLSIRVAIVETQYQNSTATMNEVKTTMSGINTKMDNFLVDYYENGNIEKHRAFINKNQIP